MKTISKDNQIDLRIENSQKVNFPLEDRQWKAFCAALDKPARKIPKLKKLFKLKEINKTWK